MAKRKSLQELGVRRPVPCSNNLQFIRNRTNKLDQIIQADTRARTISTFDEKKRKVSIENDKDTQA